MSTVPLGPGTSAWLRAHAGDYIEVRLIDLLSVVGRLAALNQDWNDVTTIQRLCNSDLPRLRDWYLPERALDEI